MSAPKDPVDLENYFIIEVENLRVGSELPFDCFLYLERNQKVLHWIRNGTVFSPDRKEKLEKLEKPRVLILKTAVPSFKQYTGMPTGTPEAQIIRGNKVGREDAIHVTGGAGKGADVIHVRGKVLVEDPIRVFGGISKQTLGAKAKSPGTLERNAESTNANRLKVDATFLNVAVTSTQAVISNICKIQVQLEATSKRSDAQKSTFPIDVASFIGLTSQTIRGTIGLCFPEQTFLALVNAATDLIFTDVQPELAIGAGEFMYQIFETTRLNLNGLGYEIDQAVPSLVLGRGLSVLHVMPDPGFTIQFKSPAGPFRFEIGIKTGG